MRNGADLSPDVKAEIAKIDEELSGLTTKFGQMEDKDELKRRIENAAMYAPLEQLALTATISVPTDTAKQRAHCVSMFSASPFGTRSC